jgi:hypothetical protein
MTPALARRARPCFTIQQQGAGMNDRDVYLKLAAVAEELMKLADEAETFVGETALKHAATTIAGTAQAVYEHAVGGESH